MDDNKYEVWTYMHKLTDEEEKSLNLDNDPYSPLPSGIVTDGRGNLYQIPKEGTTPLVTLNGDKYWKYRYNWKTQEIEVYVYDLASMDSDVDSYEYLDSYSLSANDFVDGPKYWYEFVSNELSDEIESAKAEFGIKEAIGSFGEYIFDDNKNTYNYEIRLEANLELDDWNDDYQKYEDDYTNYVSKFKYEKELYGQKLSVSADFDSYTNYVKIKISFPLPLTKEDLWDIYDEVQNYFINISPEAGYTVSTEIEDMYEL